MDVEAAPEASAEALANILSLARTAKGVELEILDLEEKLAAKSKALKALREHDLPNALKEAGFSVGDQFDLGSGWHVKLKTFTSASISAANKEAAHAWLEDHGMGGLIKRVITISFGRDEEKWAKKFLADCAKRKKALNAELKEAVHAGTLTATVKEQIARAEEEGRDPASAVPFDLFGVYRAEVADLVAPKKPKAEVL